MQEPEKRMLSPVAQVEETRTAVAASLTDADTGAGVARPAGAGGNRRRRRLRPACGFVPESGLAR